MSLVGKKAPDFVAKAAKEQEVISNFQLSDYQGHPVIFFFYPSDFTFVCPTELIAFQQKMPEFEKLGCKVFGCSVDNVHCHLAWLRTPQNQGGLQGVSYPLVADLTKEISTAFGVLKEDEGLAYRGLFLIDKEGIVRHEVINDLSLGRSIDEALRMVEALQFTEAHGEVCPANWRPGNQGLKPTQEGIQQYLS